MPKYFTHNMIDKSARTPKLFSMSIRSNFRCLRHLLIISLPTHRLVDIDIGDDIAPDFVDQSSGKAPDETWLELEEEADTEG